MIFHDELNEAQNDIDELQTEDISVNMRLLDVEGDVLMNENDIDGKFYTTEEEFTHSNVLITI